MSFLVLPTGCALFSSKPPQPEPAPLAPDEIAIVTMSDFRGAFERAEGLAQTLASLRQRFGDRMLFLDAGGLMQGSLEANLSKGRSTVALFNQLGLDATSIGSHDFDYGPDVEGRTYVKPGEDGMGSLKARMKESRFKWLAANVTGSGGPVFDAHAVFVRGGKRTCVIGVASPQTPRLTNPEFLTGMKFEPLAETVAREARDLRSLRSEDSCDFLVLLGHAGMICQAKGDCVSSTDPWNELAPLLHGLPKGTLDAVIAGQTRVLAQKKINGTPVIETGWGAERLGVLRLRGGAGNVTATLENFIAVPNEGASDAAVTALLKPYREQADAVRAREVGSATKPFIPLAGYENPLGNLLADSLLEAGKPFGATVALVNAASANHPLPEGKLTMAEIFDVFPYDNLVAVATLKGRELRRLLEIAFSGARPMPSVSGLKIRTLEVPRDRHGPWERDLNGDGKKEAWERKLVIDIRDASGKPLRDDGTYVVATLDFLMQGGENQGFVYGRVPASRKKVVEGALVRDAVAAFVKSHSPLDPDSFDITGSPRVTIVPLSEKKAKREVRR